MRLEKSKCFTITTILLIGLTSQPAQAEIKVGSVCKKFGTSETYDNKIFTCVKSGKKLVWKFTKSFSTPTPTPSPIKIISAVNDMSANNDGSSVTYKFSNVNEITADTKYEIGLSYLLNSGNDIKLFVSYSDIVVFKTFVEPSVVLTLLELKNFVASKSTVVPGISVMARVRILSNGSYSSWGNGIYLTAEQINTVPIPTQTYVPVPTQTYVPVPKQTYVPVPVPTPSSLGSSGGSSRTRGLSGCTFNGKNLYGRVKIVSYFPDVTVKEASYFADLRVQKVDMFASSCGRWQFVDSFPDFTIKFVDYFPDITIKFVDMFPGVN